MSERIISKPSTPEYREGWDRAFNKTNAHMTEKEILDIASHIFHEALHDKSEKPTVSGYNFMTGERD